MIPIAVPKTKPIREEYKPILSRAERAAYQAAHRILTECNAHPDMACPGGRRSRQIDSMAKVILEAMRQMQKER